jgi:hypothetical protein
MTKLLKTSITIVLLAGLFSPTTSTASVWDKLPIWGRKAGPVVLAGAASIYLGHLMSSKAGSGNSAYTVEFTMNRNSIRRFGGSYLPDWTPLMWPNVIAVMQVEGRADQYVFPHEEENYSGGSCMLGAYIPDIPRGKKITIRFYSSHSVPNYILNRIAQTPFNLTVKVNNDYKVAYGQCVVASGSASLGINGTIQLSDKPLDLFRNDYLGEVKLSQPWISSSDSGKIVSGSGQEIGNCSLYCGSHSGWEVLQ